MNYEEAKTMRDARDAETVAASQALRAVPGISSGAMGLTPDHVKASLDYRVARLRYDTARERLRKFNVLFQRAFKKEIARDRTRDRAARQARV